MAKGITLSEKYGVNPVIPKCFFCGEDKNEIILAGRIGRGDIEAPRNRVWDMHPCDQCREHMKAGVILISTREPTNEEERKNPYRTGGWCVVKDEAIRRMVKPDLAEKIIFRRVAFIPNDAWERFGLPPLPTTK